jgi:hypothetical protein
MSQDVFVGLLPVGTLSFLFLVLLLLLVIITQYYSYKTYRMLEKVNTKMLTIIKNRVDASLLDYGVQVQNACLPPSPEFRRFKEAFDLLNQRAKLRNGLTFFTNVEDKGGGIISVTASNVWLTGPREAKKSHLQTIYMMWKAVNCELPVEVHINDPLGNRVMSSTDR